MPMSTELHKIIFFIEKEAFLSVALNLLWQEFPFLKKYPFTGVYHFGFLY